MSSGLLVYLEKHFTINYSHYAILNLQRNVYPNLPRERDDKLDYELVKDFLLKVKMSWEEKVQVMNMAVQKLQNYYLVGLLLTFGGISAQKYIQTVGWTPILLDNQVLKVFQSQPPGSIDWTYCNPMNGNSILHYLMALENLSVEQFKEIVALTGKELINKKSDTGKTVLQFCIEFKKFHLVPCMVKEFGARPELIDDKNDRFKVFEAIANVKTPLFVVKLIVENGFHVNMKIIQQYMNSLFFVHSTFLEKLCVCVPFIKIENKQDMELFKNLLDFDSLPLKSEVMYILSTRFLFLTFF